MLDSGGTRQLAHVNSPDACNDYAQENTRPQRYKRRGTRARGIHCDSSTTRRAMMQPVPARRRLSPERQDAYGLAHLPAADFNNVHRAPKTTPTPNLPVMADQYVTFHPRDALSNTANTTLQTTAAGAIIAGVQNTLRKQNVGAMGILTRSGGIIALYGP